MRSSFSGLNTVIRGLYAQQVGLDTVGHNIANASTEGFSRQSVNLATTRPGIIYGSVGAMQIGTGVDVTAITRVRDTFMDKQLWQENSGLGYNQTAETTLGKIENVFKDQLPDVGIQAAMNKFWNTLQTLSTSASNDSARAAVREQACALVDVMHQAEGQLKNLVSDINSVLDSKVNAINQITTEIASLNHQISNIEVGGRDHANDLRDRRDLLVDQLSALADTRVFEDAGGNYTVQIGDAPVVTGGSFVKLGTMVEADPYYGFAIRSVTIGGSSQKVSFTKGEMAAYKDGIDAAVSFLNKLDKMSEFLLKDFNAIHKAGYGTDGSTGVNFFDGKALAAMADTDYDTFTPAAKSGGWLAQLQVSKTLYQTDGLNKIAAKTLALVTQSNTNGGVATLKGTYSGGTTDKTFTVRIDAADAAGNVTGISYSTGSGWVAVTGSGAFTLSDGISIEIKAKAGNAVNDTYTFRMPPQGNAAGDNAVRLSNALKIDGSDTLGGASLDEYYATVVGDIGIQSQNATHLSENQKALVDQIKTWRESVAGVNMDEEMTNMIRFQKGYNAAARIMTTMDEMLDKLINGTGVVGR